MGMAGLEARDGSILVGVFKAYSELRSVGDKRVAELSEREGRAERGCRGAGSNIVLVHLDVGNGGGMAGRGIVGGGAIGKVRRTARRALGAHT